MGKTRIDSSLVFGRSLALLLVALFVLTGAQMGLSVVRDYAKGTVLGEESDSNNKESNKWWNKRGKESVVSPRRSPEYGSPSEEKPQAAGFSKTMRSCSAGFSRIFTSERRTPSTIRPLSVKS